MEPNRLDRLARAAATAVEALFDGASGEVAELVERRCAIVRSTDAIRDASKVPPRLLDLAVTLAR